MEGLGAVATFFTRLSLVGGDVKETQCEKESFLSKPYDYEVGCMCEGKETRVPTVQKQL
jgi:hypothetical protein